MWNWHPKLHVHSTFTHSPRNSQYPQSSGGSQWNGWIDLSHIYHFSRAVIAGEFPTLWSQNHDYDKIWDLNKSQKLAWSINCLVFLKRTVVFLSVMCMYTIVNMVPGATLSPELGQYINIVIITIVHLSTEYQCCFFYCVSCMLLH